MKKKIYKQLKAFVITLAMYAPVLDEITLDAIREVLVDSIKAIDTETKKRETA